MRFKYLCIVNNFIAHTPIKCLYYFHCFVVKFAYANTGPGYGSEFYYYRMPYSCVCNNDVTFMLIIDIYDHTFSN